MLIPKPSLLPCYTPSIGKTSRQLRYIFLILLVSILLWNLLRKQSHDGSIRVLEGSVKAPVISLASSATRLRSNELAITLRSLLHQSIKPSEIRVYVANEDRDAFQWHGSHHSSRLSRYLNDERIQIHFVQHTGPSKKFMYAIKDMLEQGRLDQPLIIVDDDHSYSPDLVATLVSCAEQEAFKNSAIGLRGWRVRSSLHWGVPPEEMDEHVAEGWRLAEPFQVGVLTGNEGYLIRPRFFVEDQISASQAQVGQEKRTQGDWSPSAPVLNLTKLEESAAHLVDDIWLSGHLCQNGITRYVVPLTPPSSLSWSSVLLANDAIPSIDVTKAHALEGRIQREGHTRTTANWVALHLFERAWRKQGLFYVSKAKRKDMTRKESEGLVPRYITGIRLMRRQVLKLFHHAQIRAIFGQ
ncbi:hypothetical protein P389DRAFT_143506 [Cystobasidium minutum MCA 4210]|uniref:uncharacterized protein n=1 Tax=Cystobasidium minutum MCA 4210 TaxID=1397322 RepID=UPI0034CDDAAF|eukprot:jgi/Rhomi1/143506/e_gw1.4.439.1